MARAKSGARQDRAIEAFWSFWRGVAREVARTLVPDGGMGKALIAAFGKHVHAIDPSLDWEFGPGLKSEHCFCLSGKGDPVLRAVAERWLARAPRRTATWEFHATRQPHRKKGLTLGIGGHELELDQVVVKAAVDEAREVIDIELFHPLFPKIDDEELRSRIAFIALDTLLGEDVVERWLSVSLAKRRPRGAIGLPALSKEVTALSRRATGERWVLLEGEREGWPIYVAADQAVKRVDHLALDTHLEVAIRLADRSHPARLADAEELKVLDAMEDELVRRLGKRARLLAHETWNGLRLIHLHVEPGPEVRAKLDAWRAKHGDRTITVERTHDPRWEVLGRWR